MRKLASIRKIDGIRPIDGADAIECAIVGGWVVVVKKGEYEAGDLAIYCEIDSFIPTKLAPFLTKPGQFPKTYNGVEGERLRTVKLRGTLSQGLLLPTKIAEDIVCPGEFFSFDEGSDVTELLGIQKWEPPVSAQLAGLAKGNFPTAVPKTDQERIQNLSGKFDEWKVSALTFEVTEKLDGSSMTCYLPYEGEFEVCSRNLSLKKDENNSFWKSAIANDIERKMIDFGLRGYAIQGELVGEGIQGNKYGIKGQDFYVYDIYCVQLGKYLTHTERFEICEQLGLKHCPLINKRLKFNQTDTVSFLLDWAEDVSILNFKTQREGLVFKCVENTDISFKAISNKFLMKHGD